MPHRASASAPLALYANHMSLNAGFAGSLCIASPPEVSLSRPNWENLQLTAKLTRPPPRRRAAADRTARV